jgi:nucleoside-diphosphate-sugar epimerase
MVNNLVIGSEGFVGKELCRFLAANGESVLPFDIKRGAAEDARQARLPLEAVDRVYFLAWDVGGAKYLYRSDTQTSQLDWNLRLMMNVMPQLEATRKPFLFVSSQLAEEYDTVYGSTKRLGEVWTHLLKGVRVRLWNVYGPAEEPSERSHVVADFIHQAIHTGRIQMLTTGEERRQFIHIDDVCSAFHSALEQGIQDVYDVASFEWTRVIDVARLIAEYAGAELVPGGRVGSTPLTPMRGKIPGWSPKVTIQDGIRRLVDRVRATHVR